MDIFYFFYFFIVAAINANVASTLFALALSYKVIKIILEADKKDNYATGLQKEDDFLDNFGEAKNESEVEQYGSSRYVFIYFIRNKDLYKIGITKDLLNRMNRLNPDEILDTVRCKNYKGLEKEIHRKFKEERIPQTEYFRLNKNQVNSIHKMFVDNANR